MELISNEKINLIKSKVNIVNIISEYLSLKKRGRNYWTICPFHKDSNPSMSISPEKQIFHCFSCLEGGNIFTFLQKYENISFIEALKKVSIIANIPLNKLNNYQKKPKYNEVEQLIFKINLIASLYFSNNLETKKSYNIKEYLLKRNINNIEIELFQIGYAENGYNNLYPFLIKKGYLINEIEQTGLITIKNGKIYDYFSNRLIFPIKNEDDYIIGFSGRTIGIIDTDYKVKYLNTPETKVFKKEKIMYNINRSKSFIYNKKNIILLEGYMDVISLEKLNIKNTVALMGTNLSDFNLNKIKKIANECLIFLDGDEIGINSSLKIAIKLLNNNIKVKIVLNETKKDPDELINNGKYELVKTMILNAKNPINFAFNYFKNKFNFKKIDELEIFFNIIIPLIKASTNLLEQELAINNLIKLTGISKKTIIKKINEIKTYKKSFFSSVFRNNEFNLIKNENLICKQKQLIYSNSYLQNKNSIITKNTKYKIKNLKRYLLAEKNMILKLLISRKSFDFYQKKNCNLNFENYNLLANDIIKYYNKYLEDKNVNIEILYNEINDKNLKKILIDIINKSTIIIKYNKKELEDYFILINDFSIEKKIELLWNKLEKTNNLIKQQNISTEIYNLNKKLKFKKG